MKLGEGSKLKEINLAKNDLGTLPNCELRLFFEVLFSLPQSTETVIDLAHNKFDTSHLAMLHSTWKTKCSGKRLKRLTYCSRWCCANNGKECEDVWKLEQTTGELAF